MNNVRKNKLYGGIILLIIILFINMLIKLMVKYI